MTTKPLASITTANSTTVDDFVVITRGSSVFRLPLPNLDNLRSYYTKTQVDSLLAPEGVNVAYNPNINIDLSISRRFKICLHGNANLSVTNLRRGFYTFEIRQDSIGGRVLNLSSSFIIPGGTLNLSTKRNAKDILYCECDGINLYIRTERDYSRFLRDVSKSLVAGWGLRRLNPSYTGALIRVDRSSDNAKQDIGATTDGYLDVSALLAFVGASTGTVEIIYDQFGNNNATQTTKANQATIVTSGVLETTNGVPCLVFDGVNDVYNTTSVALGTNHSITWVGTPGNKSPNIIMGSSSTAYIGFGSNRFVVIPTSGQFQTNSLVEPNGFKTVINTRNGSTFNTSHLGTNPGVNTNTVTSGTLTLTNIGGFSTFLYLGRFVELVLGTDPTLSIPNIESNIAPYANIENSSVLVFDGNSLTFGTGATNPSTDNYPTQLLRDRLVSSNFKSYNLGVPGQTTPQMTSDAATQVDQFILPMYHKRILVAWEITNDLFFGASRDSAYNGFKSYCLARKAAGWTVVTLTIMPRTHDGVPVTFESDRLAINALLRSEFNQYADRLIDIVTLEPLFNDSNSTTYFNPDKVHLNTAGYARLAELVAPVILELVA